jgi:hypothetical protein
MAVAENVDIGKQHAIAAGAARLAPDIFQPNHGDLIEKGAKS